MKSKCCLRLTRCWANGSFSSSLVNRRFWTCNTAKPLTVLRFRARGNYPSHRKAACPWWHEKELLHCCNRRKNSNCSWVLRRRWLTYSSSFSYRQEWRWATTTQKIYSFQGSSEPFSFAQFFHRSFDTIHNIYSTARKRLYYRVAGFFVNFFPLSKITSKSLTSNPLTQFALSNPRLQPDTHFHSEYVSI